MTICKIHVDGFSSLPDNLIHPSDPEGTRTDAELIKTLQRTSLLPQKGILDPNAEAKFSLDSNIGDDGSNFSAGEKQLLALCRALVKRSRIIVLVRLYQYRIVAS